MKHYKMERIQVGDLVKHLRGRGKMTTGIVTAVRFNQRDEQYSYDVLWSCGRHSAHAEMYLMRLEAK